MVFVTDKNSNHFQYERKQEDERERIQENENNEQFVVIKKEWLTYINIFNESCFPEIWKQIRVRHLLVYSYCWN